MRTRSGFRSQLSFVPQSPNGPAGLSLAGPYYFQPECALFETNKATEGQKEAAGENDAALVSAWSASHHSPMPDLPECSKGQELRLRAGLPAQSSYLACRETGRLSDRGEHTV